MKNDNTSVTDVVFDAVYDQWLRNLDLPERAEKAIEDLEKQFSKDISIWPSIETAAMEMYSAGLDQAFEAGFYTALDMVSGLLSR